MNRLLHNIRFFLLSIFLCAAFVVNGQGQFKRVPPLWQKNLKLRDHRVNKMIENEFGEIVTTGYIRINDHKNKDFLVGHFDLDGNFIRLKMLGGTEDEEAFAIAMSWDGYYVGGYTESKWKASKKGKDGWVTKISKEGEPIWNTVIGTDYDDCVYDIISVNDGLLVGSSFADEGTVTKLDEDGKVVWQFRNGRNGSAVNKLVQINKNEFAAIGYFGKEREELMIIVGLDGDGNELWRVRTSQKGLIPKDAIWDEDLGLMVTGIGEVKRVRQEAFVCLVKEGEIEQLKYYGGKYNDGSERIVRWDRNNYWLFGYTYSHRRNARKSDIGIFSFDKNLEKKNFRHFGSKMNETVSDVLVTSGGDLFVNLIFEGPFRKRTKLVKIDHDNLSSGSKGMDPYKMLGLEYVDNNNSVFSKSDKAYIQVSLNQDAEQNPIPLWVDIKSDNPDIKIPKRYIFHPQNKDDNGIYRIPITAKKELKPTEVLLEFSLHDRNNKKKPYDMQSLSLPTETSSFSEVSLLDYNLSKEGEYFNLEVQLTNLGTVAAENINTKLINEEMVLSDDTEKVYNVIEPGDIEIQNYKFKLASKYSTNTLQVDLNCYNDALKEIGNFTLDLDLSDLLESSEKSFSNAEKVDDMLEDDPAAKAKAALLQTDFLWVSPDIDETGVNFEHIKNNLNIKLKFISDQYFDQSHFQIVINGSPAEEGVHFEELAEVLDSKPLDKEIRYTYKNKLRLDLGENKIELQLSKDGVVVSSESIVVNHNPPRPDLHLYSVGIPYENLKFTTKDAADFAKLYETQSGKLFDQVNVNVFNSAEATNKQNLVRLFENIKIDFLHKHKIKQDDVVIIYLSGHGFKDEYDSDNFRIEAADFDHYYESSTSVDFQREIYKVLERVKCKKLLFLDACHSGSISDAIELEKSGDEGDGEDYVGVSLSQAIYDLASGTSSFSFILSSRANEKSYEDKTWNNSAFLKAINEAYTNQEVKGIDGTMVMADADDNKVIYLSELYEFLTLRVPQIVKEKPDKPKTSQTPFVPKENLRDDKPLFTF